LWPSDILCSIPKNCSASLKTYAFDDTSLGSWMMGIQATYIDDSRLCCSSVRQGEIPVLMFCSGCFLAFNWGNGWRRGCLSFQVSDYVFFELELLENENIFDEQNEI